MKRTALAIIVLVASAALVYAAGITVPAGSTLSVNTGTLVVTGEVVNNGTIEVTTGVIQLTGDWTNNGTFTAGTGTVEFNGASGQVQTIAGRSGFYNLLSTSAGLTLSFEAFTTASATQDITGNFTLTGSVGTKLKVRSTVAGAQAYLNPRGTRNVSYVDVKDSRNASAECINPANSTDSGNNWNWFLELSSPIVTVEAPAGGEKWQGGSTHNIIFTATDESGIKPNTLSIWYSTDGGSTYPNVITADAAVVSPYIWTVPAANTAQARIRVSVKDNSPQQNLGTGESAANFIIDSTAPSAPNLITPANGSTTSETQPTMTWEASTDNLSGIASYEIVIDTTITTQGAAVSYTPGAPLSAGGHIWKVRAKDGAGLWGNYSSTFNFTVDTDQLPPVITVEAPVGGEKWQGGSTHNINFTATDESGIKPNSLSIWYSTNGGSTYPNVITTDAAVVSPYVWTVPAANTNQARVRVSLKDNSVRTNLGTGESAANFIIDSTPPSAPNLVTPANGSATSDNTPTLTWEASTDNLSGIASYEIVIDTTATTQDATTSFTTGTLADGAHTWEVKAKDGAGNWGSYSSTFTFEVKANGPSVASIEVRNPVTLSRLYTNSQAVTVEAFGVGGSPTQMMLSESPVFAGGGWVSYVNPTGFTLSGGEGTKEVYYKLRDVALTESSTVEAAIVYDVSPPSTPNLVTPANGSVTGDNTPTLTWEASTDNLSGIASYEIRLDTTLITPGATASYTTGVLADGVHTWEVKAKDGAANWGSYSGAFTFEVKTLGPNTTGIVLRNRTTFGQTYTNDRVISLEAQNVTGGPAELIISCSQEFSGASWASYLNPATFELTAGEGAKSVYYQLRDAGLNLSSTVEAAITYDITPPSTPELTSPANGGTINESTPTLAWNAATDNLSGIASYEINLDGSVATQGATTSYTPGTALAESPHTWEVKARDRAWNWGVYSLPSTFEVVATTTTTTTTSTTLGTSTTTTTSTSTTTVISQVSAPSVITAKQGAALNLPIKFASLNAGTYRLAIYCIDPPGPVVKDQLLTVVPGENIFNTVLDPSTPAGLYYISLTDLSTGQVKGAYINVMSRF